MFWIVNVSRRRLGALASCPTVAEKSPCCSRPVIRMLVIALILASPPLASVFRATSSWAVGSADAAFNFTKAPAADVQHAMLMMMLANGRIDPLLDLCRHHWRTVRRPVTLNPLDSRASWR